MSLQSMAALVNEGSKVGRVSKWKGQEDSSGLLLVEEALSIENDKANTNPQMSVERRDMESFMMQQRKHNPNWFQVSLVQVVSCLS